MLLRRRIVIAIVLAAVILAVAYGFLPKPVPVDIVKASRGALKVTIEEEGKTRVKDRFVISAPVAGYMRRIKLEVGDLVKKGEAVAELEPLRSTALDPRSRAEAEAALSAAESALRAAEEKARSSEAEAEYSKKKLERNKKLYNEEFITKEVFEQTETEAKQAEANRKSADAQVNVARFERDKAQTTLKYKAAGKHDDIGAVRAPVSGRVLALHRESEGAVNAGEPLIDVGDPTALEVRVEVLSADAVKIKQGTPVLFERWGGDAPLEGKVRTVEPAAFTKISSLGVEEQRVIVVADIISIPETWQRLGDGYRVEASFILWQGTDVLQIPANALFRYENGWAVFVFQNNRAYIRKVETGHRNGLSAEILSGIAQGEPVIAHPDEAIRDGTRVKVR